MDTTTAARLTAGATILVLDRPHGTILPSKAQTRLAAAATVAGIGTTRDPNRPHRPALAIRLADGRTIVATGRERIFTV